MGIKVNGTIRKRKLVYSKNKYVILGNRHDFISFGTTCNIGTRTKQKSRQNNNKNKSRKNKMDQFRNKYLVF